MLDFAVIFGIIIFAVERTDTQQYRSGHNEHDWKSCVGQKPTESSNLSCCAILTKRYRCVWRKARRINRFRAFLSPDFFLNGVFPAGSCIFLKKESQRFGRRFVGPDGLRKRRLFSFQKGRWSQRLYLKAGAIMLRPYFLCTGGVT